MANVILKDSNGTPLHLGKISVGDHTSIQDNKIEFINNDQPTRLEVNNANWKLTAAEILPYIDRGTSLGRLEQSFQTIYTHGIQVEKGMNWEGTINGQNYYTWFTDAGMEIKFGRMCFLPGSIKRTIEFTWDHPFKNEGLCILIMLQGADGSQNFTPVGYLTGGSGLNTGFTARWRADYEGAPREVAYFIAIGY